jgi:ring-1,2-phenylacetyl-CoA epoxidase subunit PaaD
MSGRTEACGAGHLAADAERQGGEAPADRASPPSHRPACEPSSAASRQSSSCNQAADLQLAHAVAAAVVDPEIPVLSLEDLGVLRGVERRDRRIHVLLTPTYIGCPATLAIAAAVHTALAQAGLPDAAVEWVLSPPWTSDDITAQGRRKLRDYGIAPPPRGTRARGLFADAIVACPRCGATQTVKISEFGSTPCKALWRCEVCAEPFDYFKCL